MSTDDGNGSSQGPSPTVPIIALFVLAIGLVVGCVLLRWFVPASNVQSAWSLEKPVASAVRVLEVDLSIRDALADSRYATLCNLVLQLPSEPLREVIDAYGDMIATSAIPADAIGSELLGKPTVTPEGEVGPSVSVARAKAVEELRFRRAVLLAEAGRVDEARGSLEALQEDDAALCAALRRAYELGAATRDVERPAALDGWQPGWARDRVEQRIAERRGIAGTMHESIERERVELRHTLERLALARAIPTLLGLIALCAWLLRNRPVLPQSTAAIPPLWSWQEGYAVVLISALAGLSINLVTILAASLLDFDYLAPWTGLVASLPMIVWMRKRLLQPYAQTMPRALGATLPGRLVVWTCVMLALFAAGELGATLIRTTSNALGAQDPWSEVIAERLLWCSRSEFTMWGIDIAVWRPIFEEIGFRGLVYLTFRRRFGPVGAALMCAGLFAALHATSITEQASILWKGLVLAAGVELTKSIVPGVVCHALGNVLVLALFAALYR